MDTIDALLASTGGGLDQPAIACRGHRNRYLGFGRLISGSGVIFPGSHRGVIFPAVRGLQAVMHEIQAILAMEQH
jgi:hypothetical protein